MIADLSSLLADPTLPEAVSTLNRVLRDEAQRRERFYDEIAPDQKAEFINGEVVMHSPANSQHTETRQRIENLIFNYVDIHGLGIVHDEKTLCAFQRNDYEPDVVFFGPKKAALIKPATLKFPPPDFVCEVLSASTEKRDRGIKFEDYQAHGVSEYWIVDPRTRTLEQYVLGRGKRYEMRLKSRSGEVESTAIKGLRLAIRAILDAKAHRAALREIIG